MRSRPEPQLAIVAGGDDVSKQETGEAHIVRTMTDGRSGLHGETTSWGFEHGNTDGGHVYLAETVRSNQRQPQQ